MPSLLCTETITNLHGGASAVGVGTGVGAKVGHGVGTGVGGPVGAGVGGGVGTLMLHELAPPLATVVNPYGHDWHVVFPGEGA